MLKIEIIKFEAQDVITTSVAAPCICSHPEGTPHADFNGNPCLAKVHDNCIWEKQNP